jgi:hypothetical protein
MEGKINFDEYNLNDRSVANELLNRLVEGGLTERGVFNTLDNDSLILHVIQMMEQGLPIVEHQYVPTTCGYPRGYKFWSREVESMLADLNRMGFGNNIGNLLDVTRQWFGQNGEVLIEHEVVGAENILVLPKRKLLWSREEGSEYETEAYRRMTCSIVQKAVENLCGNKECRHSINGFRFIEKKEQLGVVSQATSAMIDLERMYTGDFIAFPFQFGIKHRGCTSAKVLTRLDYGEFPLPLYAIAIALQLFSERLKLTKQDYGDKSLYNIINKRLLVCTCGGDKYLPKRGQIHRYSRNLSFDLMTHVEGDAWEITLDIGDDACNTLEGLRRQGVVTGFVPQLE